MNDDLKQQLEDTNPNQAGEEGVSQTSQAVEPVDELQVNEPEVTSGDPGLSEENTNASADPVAEDATSDAQPEAEAKTADESLASEDQKIIEDGSSDLVIPEEEAPVDESGAKWYVVHTYSGHENRVAASLKQRVESEHLESKIVEVLVPTQDKIEIKSGKKETIKEKIFPGYILVKMVLEDASWLCVRTTQGVTSFVGMGNKPTPIPEHEVKSIVSFMTQGAQPTYKTVYSEGDTVKIVDGPFSEFIGKVESVDKDRGKVRVLVSIFGRETPVELDFLQVNKL